MFASPSQKPRGSIASSNGGSISRTSPIVEIKHATPPRPPLPSSSPSSQRLRELAPSPLVFLPSKLRYSPESPTLSRTASSTSPSSAATPSSQARVLDFSRSRTPEPAGETLEWPDEVPLIFDGSGEYRMPLHNAPTHAYTADHLVQSQLRDYLGPGSVPERIGDGEAEDEEAMTTGEYVRTHFAREVMVNFRTDVFSPTSAASTNHANTTAQTTGAGTAPAQGQVSIPCRATRASDGRVALRESFATFGRNRSDHSVMTTSTVTATGGRRDTDAFSISLYERDDSRDPAADAPVPPSPIRDADEEGDDVPPLLDAAYEDSPAGASVELITPDHPHAALPQSRHQEHETPTAKPQKQKQKHKAGRMSRLDSPAAQGLQLTLDPLDTVNAEFEDLRGVDAGTTPGPGTRRPSISQVERVPSLPTLVKRRSPPVAHTTPVAEESVDTTPRPKQRQDGTLADLESFDRSTFIDIEIDQDGSPSWTTRMLVRRLAKPEFWQAKEEEALAKAIKWSDPPPKPQPFQATGCVVLGQPPRQRDKWYFTAAPDARVPVVTRITANGNSSHDLVGQSQKVCLAIMDFGVYHVSGLDQWGRVEWQLEYLVIHRTENDDDEGPIIPDARIVVPMHLYATTSFFDQRQTNTTPRSGSPPQQQTILMGERMPVVKLGRPPVRPVQSLQQLSKRNRMPTPTQAPRHERYETSPPEAQARPPTDHPFTDPRNIRTADNTPAATPVSPPQPHPILIGSTVSVGMDLSSSGTTPSTANGTSSSGSGGKVSGFLHKFGAKSKSRQQLQQQQTSPEKEGESDSPRESGPGTSGRAESIKSTKNRGRAASLLQKIARPFTPPTAMDKDLPPVPKLSSPGLGLGLGLPQSPTPVSARRLSPMKSLSSLHPNTPTPTSQTSQRPPMPAPLPPLLPMPRSAGFVPANAGHQLPTHLTNAAVVRTARHHHASGSLDFRSSANPPQSIMASASTSAGTGTGSGQAGAPVRGLAPPIMRPILRKRPSTADPAVPNTGTLSRLGSRKPM